MKNDFELFIKVFNNYDLVTIIKSFIDEIPENDPSEILYLNSSGAYYRKLNHSDFIYLAALKFGYLDQLINLKSFKFTNKLPKAILAERDISTYRDCYKKLIHPGLEMPYFSPLLITKEMILYSLHLNDFPIFKNLIEYYSAHYIEISKNFEGLEDFCLIYELALKLNLDSKYLTLILQCLNQNEINKYSFENIILTGLDYQSPQGLLLFLESKNDLIKSFLPKINLLSIKRKLYNNIDYINKRHFDPDFNDDNFYFSTYIIDTFDNLTNNDFELKSNTKDILISNPGLESFQNYASLMIDIYTKLNAKKKFYGDNLSNILRNYNNIWTNFQYSVAKALIKSKRSELSLLDVYKKIHQKIMEIQ